MSDGLRWPHVARRWRPSRNIIALSVVSFLTDASTEIIAPLLPLFLVGTLGASASFVGIIEGTAEAVASLLKLGSGWWSDRTSRRKPLIVIGYSIASLVRPLVAVAQTAGQVLAIRVTDRIGKGMRGAPRDALLADSVAPEHRGRAFGFHRAADHAGAVAGPLIAVVCLQYFGMSIRSVFWVAVVPGMLAVVVAIVFVREASRRDVSTGATARATSRATARATPARRWPGQMQLEPGSRREFRATMVAFLVFALGNSTDAFLLLRASQLGIPVAHLPLLWMVLHVVKSATSTPGGALSDRLGRRPLIIAGWLLYAAVYVAFAWASEPWHAWALFATYGMVFGLTEGSEKALVAEIVPPASRGTAFGWYHATVGTAALPASLLFGVLWDGYGAPVAFTVGAGLALAAAALLARRPAGLSQPA